LHFRMLAGITPKSDCGAQNPPLLAFDARRALRPSGCSVAFAPIVKSNLRAARKFPAA
jgi:hypothetical protein